MAEKATQVHIRLKTSGDTSGIKEVEKAHDQLWAQMRERHIEALTEQLGLTPEEAKSAREVLDTVKEGIDDLAKGGPQSIVAFAKELESKLGPAMAELEKKVLARREAEYQAHRKKMEIWKREEMEQEAIMEEANFRARMLHGHEEIQMQKALAQAAQMRLEQEIVSRTPTYTPANDARRWREQVTGIANVEAASRRAAGGVGGLNQVLTQAAFLVDDAQYGWRGMSNNLQQLALSIPAVGGALALAVPLIGVFINRIEEAEKQKLDGVRKEAELTTAAFERLGESMRETFEQDLERWKAELEKALHGYTTAMETAASGKGRMDAEAQAKLDLDLAKLDQEKQGQLNIAPDNKERRKRVEEEFAAREAKLRRAAERESLQREITLREQNLQMVGHGKAEAEKQLNERKESLRSAPAAEANVRERMMGVGVFSDQDKVLMEFEQAQRDMEIARQRLEEGIARREEAMKSGHIGTLQAVSINKQIEEARKAEDEAIQKLNGMRQRAQLAQEDIAANRQSFEGAAKGEGLTPDQQAQATSLLAELDNIRKQAEADRAAIEAAEKQIAEVAEKQKAESSALEVAKTRAEAVDVREKTASSVVRVAEVPQVPLPPAPSEDATEWGTAANQIKFAMQDASKRTSNVGAKAALDGLIKTMENGTTEEEMKRVADRLGSMLGKRNEALAALANGVGELADFIASALGSVNAAQQKIAATQKSIVPRG